MGASPKTALRKIVDRTLPEFPAPERRHPPDSAGGIVRQQPDPSP